PSPPPPLDRSAFLRVKKYIPIDQRCNDISGDQNLAHIGFGNTNSYRHSVYDASSQIRQSRSELDLQAPSSSGIIAFACLE
ncbi:hypothetical protein OG21DRAFT_1514802, partial [Imleria badia]